MNRYPKLTAKDAAALQEFLREVRTALGANVAEIKLFGSKATGRDQTDSDIDILVALNHGSVEAEDQVLDIAFNVNLKHDVYISPRVIDCAVLSDPVWRITPFLKAIEIEGIRL
jgi:predicted nucleotidyltransferase